MQGEGYRVLVEKAVENPKEKAPFCLPKERGGNERSQPQEPAHPSLKVTSLLCSAAAWLPSCPDAGKLQTAGGEAAPEIRSVSWVPAPEMMPESRLQSVGMVSPPPPVSFKPLTLQDARSY